MRSYDEIYAIAAERKGGAAALEALIAEHRPKTAAGLAKTPDDRILSVMSRCVFQAGFAWKVIDQKWPGFETAFHGFDPHWCAAMSDEAFDGLLKDKGIVRNAQKILSVQANGRWLVELAQAHGSAAAFFAGWPDDDYVGLLETLKTKASRLGGNAGMRVLRMIGKPSFITSRDVVAALVREGVVAKEPSSRKDFKAVQDAFNAWSRQSGRDLTSISRTLALSIG